MAKRKVEPAPEATGDGLPGTALRRRLPTHADAWSDALLDAGALSVDLSDPFAGTAGRVAALRRARPSRPRLRGRARASIALFAPAADARAASGDRRARDRRCRRRRTRSPRWPKRTGCARRRRSSAPSRSRAASGSCPRGSSRAGSAGAQPAARSGPRVRHRLASDDAAVPRVAARAHAAAASACSTTAAVPASSRSPRARLGAATRHRHRHRSAGHSRQPRQCARRTTLPATLRGARRARPRRVRHRGRQHPCQSADRARTGAGVTACAPRRSHRAVRASSTTRPPTVTAAYARWFTLAPWRRARRLDAALRRTRAMTPDSPHLDDGRRTIHPLPRLQDRLSRDRAATGFARRPGTLRTLPYGVQRPRTSSSRSTPPRSPGPMSAESTSSRSARPPSRLRSAHALDPPPPEPVRAGATRADAGADGRGRRLRESLRVAKRKPRSRCVAGAGHRRDSAARCSSLVAAGVAALPRCAGGARAVDAPAAGRDCAPSTGCAIRPLRNVAGTVASRRPTCRPIPRTAGC